MLRVGDFDGVNISSPSLGSQEFLSVVTRSLEMISQYDRVSYTRVKDQFEWIMNGACAGGAGSCDCFPKGKSCRIDFTNFGWDDQELVAGYFACLIVRLATYSRLYNRGIIRNENNYVRHQRLCHRSYTRFLKIIDKHLPGVYETWHNDFTVSPPQPLLARTLKKLRRGFVRLSEIWSHD